MSSMRLFYMKSHVKPINEPTGMAQSMGCLQVTLERVARLNLVSVILGIGLLIGTGGCEVTLPVDSDLSNVSASHETGVSPESLTVPRVINLGDVSPGGQVSQWIEIHNPHAHDVEIVEVRVGCECVSVTLDSTTISRGRSVRALVVADLSYLPDFEGALAVPVTIIDRSGKEYQHFRVDLYVASPSNEDGSRSGKNIDPTSSAIRDVPV